LIPLRGGKRLARRAVLEKEKRRRNIREVIKLPTLGQEAKNQSFCFHNEQENSTTNERGEEKTKHRGTKLGEVGGRKECRRRHQTDLGTVREVRDG